MQIEKDLRNKEISKALNEHFGIQVKTDKRIRDMMSTEAGRLKLAKDLAKESKKFRDLIYDTADGVEEIVEEISFILIAFPSSFPGSKLKFLKKSVLTIPGFIMLTLIFLFAISLLRASEKPFNPNFVVQ